MPNQVSITYIEDTWPAISGKPAKEKMTKDKEDWVMNIVDPAEDRLRTGNGPMWCDENNSNYDDGIPILKGN